MKEYIAEYIVPVVPADEKGKNLKFDFMNAKRLIQCKDCKYYTGYECQRTKVSNIRVITNEDDYCSRAERKETS